MKNEVAEIQKLQIANAKIKIKGLSPLIVHKFSEKAKKQMLDKSTKKAKLKEPKNPEQEFEDAKYLLNDKPAFPADAFKKSMIRGAKQLGLVMVDMRTGFFVHGVYSDLDDRDLIPINGKYTMREDTVRVNSGGADLRYRPQVVEWTAELEISFNSNVVSFDQIVNMLNAAGYGVGIGDWRPERDGMFGRFTVVS